MGPVGGTGPQHRGRRAGGLFRSDHYLCVDAYGFPFPHTPVDDVRRRARAVMARVGDTGTDQDRLDRRRDDWVVGTPDEVAEGIEELQDAGVQRVMLQHLDSRRPHHGALMCEITRRCPS